MISEYPIIKSITKVCHDSGTGIYIYQFIKYLLQPPKYSKTMKETSFPTKCE